MKFSTIDRPGYIESALCSGIPCSMDKIDTDTPIYNLSQHGLIHLLSVGKLQLIEVPVSANSTISLTEGRMTFCVVMISRFSFAPIYVKYKLGFISLITLDSRDWCDFVVNTVSKTDNV
jgi:hypothetical protein